MLIGLPFYDVFIREFGVRFQVSVFNAAAGLKSG
jgi:hypothetical protein